MANYLSQDDVNQFGPQLIDVSQRAAMHALAPTLQQIQQQNAQLQQRLAIESRRRLDSEIARAVPDYQEIDRNPRWHRWLLGIDSLSGQVRQTLLNSAVSRGDPQLVKNFFDQFKREAGGAQAPASTGATSRPTPFGQARSSSIGTRTYSRPQIQELYERHRKGEFTDQKWSEIENDIFKAQHESRIVAHPYITK